MNPQESKQNLVSNWLDTYPSYNTRRNYRTTTKQFFKSVYGHSSLDQLDQQAKEYFKKERNHKEDIFNFIKSINHQAPLTVKLKISGIRTFFLEQNHEFRKSFWKKIGRQVKGSKAVTLDRTPTTKELRQILSHMRAKGKAFYLTMSSSGMRIGEALQLKLEDIDFTEDLVKIRLRGEYTKSGNSRYCFASQEALEALREWLKTRKNYLKQSAGRSNRFEKKLQDDRVFPFTKSTAYYIWNTALDKAELNGKDKTTGRRKLHPHSLRKFFRTKMASIIQADIVEALIGHANYLTEVYRRYTEQDLEKFYLKAESSILIFTEAEQVTKLRKEVEESKDQLQTLVNGLTSENLELKSRMSKVELENTTLKMEIQKVKTIMDKLADQIEKIELQQEE